MAKQVFIKGILEHKYAGGDLSEEAAADAIDFITAALKENSIDPLSNSY